MLGNNVLKPSNAAAPGLSVTPGLNPTDITASGHILNKSRLEINNSLVHECSIIGSANKSSTLFPISSGVIDEEIKKPTILLTLPTLIPWSANNCRLTTSPLTSRRPSPSLGVTSTLVMFIMAAAPTGMILWR